MHSECSYKNNDSWINAKKFDRGKAIFVVFASEGLSLKIFLIQWKSSTEIDTI